MKNILQSGDLLIIKSIDRLGRNYDMIIEEWKDLVNHQNIDIVVISQGKNWKKTLLLIC